MDFLRRGRMAALSANTAVAAPRQLILTIRRLTRDARLRNSQRLSPAAAAAA